MRDDDVQRGADDVISTGIDVSTPNAARMYDYMLGGCHNFAVDRDAVDAMLHTAGTTAAPARLNRSFLRRAVRFLLDAGIDQFLDLGSGIPTRGNVHEIAQEANPDARVVYVDNDPVAVAQSRQLLDGNPNATIVTADLRDVDAVLGHPDTVRLLDRTRPVGVLMVSVLHFIADADDPPAIVARYRDAMTGGGYLALSHFTVNDNDQARQGAAHYRRTATPVVGRTREQLGGLFDGFELVSPGLVWTPEWRPDDVDPVLADPADSRIYAAVGRRLP